MCSGSAFPEGLVGLGATWRLPDNRLGSARADRRGPADRWTGFGVTRLAQNSARGHFGVTSGSLGSPELGSGSLRETLKTLHRRVFLSFSADRLAQNSARGHFGVTWVAQNSARGHFGVTSGPLRGHFGVTGLARNSARGHFGATSGSLGSRKLGSGSLRSRLARENSARGHFEATWRDPEAS